jgi:hypothetical protein
MEWDLTEPELPNTVASAVDILLKDLGEENLALIRTTEYDDLIDHHFGMGLLIRSLFVLHDNPGLVQDTGTTNADDASLKILQALWRRMRH